VTSERASAACGRGWRRDETSKQNLKQNPQQDAAPLRKRPGLQGPIDDAFMEPFVFIGPKAPPDGSSAVEAWAREEYARATREWRRHFRGEIVERRAVDVTPQDIAERNLVLFGTADSNPIIAKVMPGLPLRRRLQRRALRPGLRRQLGRRRARLVAGDDGGRQPR
jgi:hypothetical protein